MDIKSKYDESENDKRWHSLLKTRDYCSHYCPFESYRANATCLLVRLFRAAGFNISVIKESLWDISSRMAAIFANIGPVSVAQA